MEKEIQEKALKLFWKYYNDPKNTIKYDDIWTIIYNEDGERLCTMVYKNNVNHIRLIFKEYTAEVDIEVDMKDLFFEYKKKFDEDRFSSMLEFFNKELDNEVKV